MKKTVAIISCILIGIMGIALTGCGDKYADSPYVGTWKATTAEYSGVELEVEKILGEFILTNEADGTCTVTLQGSDSKGEWEPSENGFIVDSQENMEFVEKDGVLTLDYSGVVIHFEKQ